jgi:hypothetical protein
LSVQLMNIARTPSKLKSAIVTPFVGRRGRSSINRGSAVEEYLRLMQRLHAARGTFAETKMLQRCLGAPIAALA